MHHEAPARARALPRRRGRAAAAVGELQVAIRQVHEVPRRQLLGAYLKQVKGVAGDSKVSNAWNMVLAFQKV